MCVPVRACVGMCVCVCLCLSSGKVACMCVRVSVCLSPGQVTRAPVCVFELGTQRQRHTCRPTHAHWHTGTHKPLSLLRVSLSLWLPLAQTHTRAHTHARVACPELTHTHTRARATCPGLKHTDTRTHMHATFPELKHKHTHTHIPTHARTGTHTALSPSLSVCISLS